MHLYLIRHGKQRPLNESDTNRADPDLTDEGRHQANALAHWLPGEIPVVDALYSSPMLRARLTASPIAEAYGCTFVQDARLGDFGGSRADGSPFPLDRLPHRAPGVIVNKEPYRRITDNEDGESYMDMRSRTARFLDDLIARHASQKVLVVTHSGVIAAAVETVLNAGPWRRCEVLPTYSSVTHVEYRYPTPYEPWCLHYLGRVDHLVKQAG